MPKVKIEPTEPSDTPAAVSAAPSPSPRPAPQPQPKPQPQPSPGPRGPRGASPLQTKVEPPTLSDGDRDALLRQLIEELQPGIIGIVLRRLREQYGISTVRATAEFISHLKPMAKGICRIHVGNLENRERIERAAVERANRV